MSYLIRTFPGFQKWAYNFAGFNQYGLYRDDLLHETEDVTEALKRVPPHIIEERDFRLVRAIQLDLQKKVLPKEQWTKLEEDIHYLLPHVQDVIRERKEKEAWEAQ